MIFNASKQTEAKKETKPILLPCKQSHFVSKRNNQHGKKNIKLS